MLNEYNMQLIFLCRGGFFPSVDAAKRQKAIDDNLFAIEQAATVDTPVIVLVCGADNEQSLEKSREKIQEEIMQILPAA